MRVSWWPGWQGLLMCVLLGLGGPPALAQVADVASPLRWNQPAVLADCPDEPSYLWVETTAGPACARYFAGDDLTQAPVVIVQFYGDRDRVMRQPPEQIRSNTRQAQEGYARRQSARVGVPVVVMARPGTYGSSGDHAQRRQRAEFDVLDAALDALRQRYGIERVVLLGHSGGATAAAALLTLGRKDVSCAVLTSGAYGLLERAAWLETRAGRVPRQGRDTTGLPNPYDPLAHVDQIVADPTRQIVIAGSPQDIVTPFFLQQRMAAMMANAGHRVQLVEAEATAPQFHNLQGDVGMRLASSCAVGPALIR